MRNEIRYHASNLDRHISCLRSLKAELDSIDVTVEESDAARGANSNTIREINATYPMIKEALSGLLNSSVEFFSKVSADIVLADKNAREQVQQLKKIGGEGK